jgi:hypothetical protein
VTAATHKTIKVLIRIVTLSKVERPVSSAGFCKSGELILKGALRKSKGATPFNYGWKGASTGFPLANKRGTRLRGDHAQTRRLGLDPIYSNRIMT